VLTFSEVALNTEIALLIQIVFFGSIFGAISGIYHRVRKWRGDPCGPKGKTVVRGLCIVLVIVYGLAAIWQVNATDSRALWDAIALGAGYGALRVLGTALVFRGVRRMIAGKVVASGTTA
jgi:hypothetical protein